MLHRCSLIEVRSAYQFASFIVQIRAGPNDWAILHVNALCYIYSMLHCIHCLASLQMVASSHCV